MKKEMVKNSRSSAVMIALFIFKILLGIFIFVLQSLSKQRPSVSETSYDRLMKLGTLDPKIIDPHPPKDN